MINFCYSICKNSKTQVLNSTVSTSNFDQLSTSETYSFEEIGKRDNITGLNLFKFTNSQSENVSHYSWIEIKAFQLPRPKSKLNCLWIINKNKLLNSKTIILTHSKKECLSNIYSMILDLSSLFKCDVISFDYSENNYSLGHSESHSMIEDLDTVLKFSMNKLFITENDILLFGIEEGCQPALKITSLHGKFFGIVLMSPILEKINIFNLNLIEYPIFLIHGELNENFPLREIAEMTKNVKKIYSWFPRKGTSTNILPRYRLKFIEKFKFFLDFAQRIQKYGEFLPTKSQKHDNRKPMLLNYKNKKDKNSLGKMTLNKENLLKRIMNDNNTIIEENSTNSLN